VSSRLTHWEGEPVRVWEGLWAVPLVEAWETLGSSNDRVRELAAQGCAPWSVVLAEEQTAGRGRAGRSWSSPRGVGLWISFLAPRRPAGHALAPVLVGVALARAVESLAPVEAGLKWPNDLLVGGRKAAGILCEATGDALVVGVGVNVRQRPEDFPPELQGRATSLDAEAGGRVSRAALAGALLRGARALLDRPVLRLDGELAREVERRDVLRGRAVTVDGTHGRGDGVDPLGRLRLAMDDGRIRPVVAGHVEPADPGA
jgi:BirA family biotin operon repressor/biotin-[acetyl-CoA-carboxylase] ligase